MTKKVKKKTKIRPLRFFLFLIVLAGIIAVLYFYLTLPVKNLIVSGTSTLTDAEVLELAGLSDYPSFYFTGSNKIKRQLLANPFIKEVSVKREFFHVINLEITEYKVLFFNKSTNEYILENKKSVSKEDINLSLPILLNYVPDVKYDTFVSKMASIDDSIRQHISEIEYVPNDYDKDRFFLYMDDGNGVYLTLTKFDKINHYLEVLKEVNGKKGIFYFDSGNHFEVIE